MTDHLYREIAKLRQQLDEAKATIADMRKAADEQMMQFAGVARLTASEARIVSLVVARRRVTWGQIEFELWNDKDDPGFSRETIGVMLCRIRQKIKPHGITIRTVWGMGIEVDEESRNALRHLAGMPVVESPPLAMEQAA